MPDAASRVTIFFESQGGVAPTGWTETYWTPNSDLQAVVNQCLATYLPKRRALLGVGVSIKYARATANPGNRLSYIEFVNGKQATASLFTNSPADNFDPTQVDLLCRVQTQNGHRRQLWIGGLPDSQTDQLVNQGILGAFTASPAWKQFVQAILDCGYGVRYKTGNGPPPTYEFGSIQQVFPMQVRNRKRGRPFNLFRGRVAV